jgi:phage repressor protein C with HTH and peptisase S24 domain
VSEKDEAFAKRLRELIGEHKSINAAAARWGISNSLLRKYLEGTVPGLDKAARIAEVHSVSLRWLASGKGPKRQAENAGLGADLTLIPRLDVEAAAGTGALALNEEPVSLLAFDSEWLRRRGINPRTAHVLTARGDSMEPTIRSGDVLLVDTSINMIQDAGIYIVRVGGLLLLKRIHVKMNKSLTLISDNKEVYPPEELSAHDAVDLYVAGRVMWFGRSI